MGLVLPDFEGSIDLASCKRKSGINLYYYIAARNSIGPMNIQFFWISVQLTAVAAHEYRRKSRCEEIRLSLDYSTATSGIIEFVDDKSAEGTRGRFKRIISLEYYDQ